MFVSFRCRRPLVVLAAIASCSAATASTQTPSPFAYWQNSAGIVLRPLAGPPPEWQIMSGPGVVAEPTYEGADTTRVLPFPEIDIRYRNIAFASMGDGIGVNLLRGQNYRAGIAIAYDVGREHNLATRLSGTGNIDPTPEATVFAEYSLLPLIVSADIRQGMIGHQGLIGDLGFYMPIAGDETFDVFLGPAITAADTEYMQSYFGISAQHAAPHSIFPVYHASGGVKNANFGISGDYRFTEHWSLHSDVGLERLLGSAADSPLVHSKWQLGSDMALGYMF